jgi:hypothetical protein
MESRARPRPSIASGSLESPPAAFHNAALTTIGAGRAVKHDDGSPPRRDRPHEALHRLVARAYPYSSTRSCQTRCTVKTGVELVGDRRAIDRRGKPRGADPENGVAGFASDPANVWPHLGRRPPHDRWRLPAATPQSRGPYWPPLPGAAGRTGRSSRGERPPPLRCDGSSIGARGGRESAAVSASSGKWASTSLEERSSQDV